MNWVMRLAHRLLLEWGPDLADEDGDGLKTRQAIDRELEEEARQPDGRLPKNWQTWGAEQRAVAFVQALCARQGLPIGDVDGKAGSNTSLQAPTLARPAINRFAQQLLGNFGPEEKERKLGPRTSLALELEARKEGMPKGWSARQNVVAFIQLLCRQSGFKEVGAVDGALGPNTLDAFDSLERGYRKGPRIGLALSGGGFRSSIFHLGVIQRLEELDLMSRVNVISSVSGGSIIGAYYVIEMERRLRGRHLPDGLSPAEAAEAMRQARLQAFDEIAESFFRATDRNLRIRALLFSPFYHPLKTLKLLTKGFNRADLMQAEYDRWFYHGDTLDQLPNVTAGGYGPSGLSGPKLVINTTSLLTGRRVAFSRESMSGIRELSKVNTNVLPLSRIVGASAGVPGLFPPTPVSGDLLVDGGVCDNQGLEGLRNEDCDVILVSDASGQIEQLHRLKDKAVAVLSRTNAIFQSGIRTQLLERLRHWNRQMPYLREFAFVHLHMNLKGRAKPTERVPSEYVAALARIRTDLDQFSRVEREALMFHGYTLIDHQLEQYCRRLLKRVQAPDADPAEEKKERKLRVPPLFQPGGEQDAEKRSEIKKILTAGQRPLLILRALARGGAKAAIAIALGWLLPMVLFLRFGFSPLVGYLFERLQPLSSWLQATTSPLETRLGPLLSPYASWPITFRGTVALGVFLVSSYVLIFMTFSVIRWLSGKWDERTYRRLTEGLSGDPSPSSVKTSSTGTLVDTG